MLNSIREKLVSLQDEKYREFQSKLCPNTDNILGVRLPALKQIAKDIAKSNDLKTYLNLAKDNYTKDSYHEEIMVYGLVIGFAKISINETQKYLDDFLPLIDNWAVCDSVCANLKITKKYPSQMFEFLKTQLKSNKPFYIRFAIVLLLDFYINEQYIEEIFNIVDSIDNQDYYVKMVIAWCLSICYIKMPEITINYLNKCSLDDYTFNKTLQKICESKRVSNEQRIFIKNMKRNVK